MGPKRQLGSLKNTGVAVRTKLIQTVVWFLQRLGSEEGRGVRGVFWRALRSIPFCSTRAFFFSLS